MNPFLKIEKDRCYLERLLIEADVVSFQLFIQRSVFDAQEFCCAFLTSIALAKGPDQNALFHTANEFFKGDPLPDAKIFNEKIEDLLAESPLFPFFEILRAYLLDGFRLKVCPADRSSEGRNTLVCVYVFRSHCISPFIP